MHSENENRPMDEHQHSPEDEALFEALKKNKKRKRRRRIRMIVILLILLLVGGFVGTRFLQKRVQTQFTSKEEEVLSAQAQRGTISTLVSGSGMLVNVETQVVSVPSGVEVTEILVEYGDTVKEGDLLATVDMASVRTVMSDLQSKIESLDKEIASAKGDKVASSISSKVPGRIKAVYAQKGDLVEDIMVDFGALAIVSLDGFMQAELETEALHQGDTVTVVLEDGGEKEGTVSSVLAGKATILLTDNVPKLDEEVTIRSADGQTLGTAKLTVHNPMAITGYAGTISGVNIQENQQIYAGAPLFSLTDTSTTASYDALLRTRSEYEKTLLELLSLQRNQALIAPISGSIYSAADLSGDSEEEILDIVTISPDKQMEVSIKIDEGDILSLELDQKADVTVSSIGEEALEGVVTEIDKTYSSGYYTALVTLDKTAGMIPGMTASVDIRIEGVDDAILIPADALHQTSSGYYVYTSYDEETKEYGGRTDVIPGLSNSNFVEIKSGLNEGDTVYYEKAPTFAFPFGSFGGKMPSSGMSGSGMSGNSFGGMTSGSSNRPSGSGSNRPSGGNMPSGMPSGFPSGFGG